MNPQDIIGPRIGLSICFGISGIIFFMLLLDNHYKCIKKEILKSAFGKSTK